MTNTHTNNLPKQKQRKSSQTLLINKEKHQTTYPEKAAAYFKQGYNCAQSILLTMQEYHHLNKNELIPKIATAFGAGIARQGSLCGALTGAILAISLKHGTNTPLLKNREKAYTLAQKFSQQFKKECGSHYCRELIGYDLTKPEELEKAQKYNVFDKKCTGYVKKAIQILTQLETKHKEAPSGI